MNWGISVATELLLNLGFLVLILNFGQFIFQETCRYCKEEWTEHFGKKCEEIEKKDETKLRLE